MKPTFVTDIATGVGHASVAQWAACKRLDVAEQGWWAAIGGTHSVFPVRERPADEMAAGTPRICM